MTKHFTIAVVALVAVLLISGQAQAQGLGPGGIAGSRSVGRPTVSPYLNLVVADGFSQLGLGGGYQTLVRPFVDSRKATNANAAAISRLQTQVDAGGGGGGGGRSSGSAGFFMNYSHYYPGLSGSGR